MRLALLFAAALVACAADPVPLTACTAGVSTACNCSTGATGAQVCRADGSGYGACVCSAGDAGAVGDAPQSDAGADVVSDAGGDADAVGDASDVPSDLPCMGRAGLTYCEAPSPGCFDLQTEVIHCGRCHNLCVGPRSRCIAGECVP